MTLNEAHRRLSRITGAIALAIAIASRLPPGALRPKLKDWARDLREVADAFERLGDK